MKRMTQNSREVEASLCRLRLAAPTSLHMQSQDVLTLLLKVQTWEWKQKNKRKNVKFEELRGNGTLQQSKNVFFVCFFFTISHMIEFPDNWWSQRKNRGPTAPWIILACSRWPPSLYLFLHPSHSHSRTALPLYNIEIEKRLKDRGGKKRGRDWRREQRAEGRRVANHGVSMYHCTTASSLTERGFYF